MVERMSFAYRSGDRAATFILRPVNHDVELEREIVEGVADRLVDAAGDALGDDCEPRSGMELVAFTHQH
ncbi:hypothetical protein GCM10009563_24370 [Subtercola frigoramans]